MALSWKFNQQTAGLTFLAVGAYQASRSSSLPPLYQLFQETGSDITAAHISQGKSLVDGIILGVGAGLVADSFWPLAAVFAMVVVDAVFCQMALLSNSSEDD